MKCPACSGSLEALPLEKVEIDRCPSCEGIWFDVGELETHLAARAGHEADPKLSFRRTQTGSPLCCPRCQSDTLEPGRARGGRELRRCSGCHGAFVPRKTLRKLDESFTVKDGVIALLDGGMSVALERFFDELISHLFDGS